MIIIAVKTYSTNQTNHGKLWGYVGLYKHELPWDNKVRFLASEECFTCQR